jgi:hypothetical protein
MYFFYIILFAIALFSSFVFASSGSTLLVKKRATEAKVMYAISFLVLLTFIGLRYNVGGDYINYSGDYKTVDSADFGQVFSYYKFEYGYLAIIEICRFFYLGPQGVFFITTLLTLVLYFNLFRGKLELLAPSLFVFLMSTPYVFMINGVRQTIAIFAFLNAINSLNEGTHLQRSIRFLVWMAFGALFHNSIVFFIPIILLQFDGLFTKLNSKILILIAVSGFVLNVIGVTKNFLPETQILTDEGYGYGRTFDDERFNVEGSILSIGNLFSLCLYLIPLFLYDKIKSKYSNLSVFFLTFAIGCAIYFIFTDNMFSQRISYYFLFSELLVFPILSVFYKRRMKGINWWMICVLMIFALFVISLPLFMDNQLWPGASIWGIGVN